MSTHGLLIGFLQWALAALAVEAVTEIFVSSSLFAWIRRALARMPGRCGIFLGEWSSCGYCFSVWASAAIAWALPGDLLPVTPVGFAFNALIRTLALHRLSNVVHGTIIGICRRPPKEIVISHLGLGEDGKDDGMGHGRAEGLPSREAARFPDDAP